MSAFDLYWSQLVSLIKFVELERAMQRGVHLNKSRILFLLLLFCCFVLILFISFRDSMKVLIGNRFPCITWDVSGPVRFTMLGLSCVRSKFEYLCGFLKETNKIETKQQKSKSKNNILDLFKWTHCMVLWSSTNFIKDMSWLQQRSKALMNV